MTSAWSSGRDQAPWPKVGNVSVILLAAGESKRMGQQKALLPWASTTLIEYQLDQLTSVEDVAEIIVVTGHAPARIVEAVGRYERARAIENAAYQSGKVSSILAGLTAVDDRTSAILLLAVDQPRSASITEVLIRAHQAQRALITVPVREGRRGHPVLFDRSLLPELLAISEETLGIRAVIANHEDDVSEVTIDDPAIHVDLNEPGDLR